MSADEVAKAFIPHYYNLFDTNREGLVSLFRETSSLTFEGDGPKTGVAQIMEKLRGCRRRATARRNSFAPRARARSTPSGRRPYRAPAAQVAHQPQTIECQPSVSQNAILVFCTGQIMARRAASALGFVARRASPRARRDAAAPAQIEQGKPLKYSEVFQLVASAPGQYYLNNVMFRFNYAGARAPPDAAPRVPAVPSPRVTALRPGLIPIFSIMSAYGSTCAGWRTASWNVAAINNNPWVLHGPPVPKYHAIMEGVQKFVAAPGADDVAVSAVFTEAMMAGLEAAMLGAGIAARSRTRGPTGRRTSGTARSCRASSGRRHGREAALQHAGPRDEHHRPRGGSVACRPTVINMYGGELGSVEAWWPQWRAFFFEDKVAVVDKKAGKAEKLPALMLSKIPRAKYPALTEAEEAMSVPLQLVCCAVFDAVLVHMMNKVSPGAGSRSSRLDDKSKKMLADGDVFAVTASTKTPGAPPKVLVASFHGDTNGLATIPVLGAREASADLGLPLVFGLDANAHTADRAKPGKNLGWPEFVAAVEKTASLAQCHDLGPDGKTPPPLSTFNARTYIQPQLNKAVPLEDKATSKLTDRNPKDYVVFDKAVFSAVDVGVDNTGDAARSYSDAPFPTLAFPSDHGATLAFDRSP
ncbi:hypothetical protein JL721_4406 [Aureococcus anophagefferens]|nr:hypothetical protein JL721_4406 [Aureococcus anophagefferens]